MAWVDALNRKSTVGMTIRIVLLVAPPAFYLQILMPCWECYDFEVSEAGWQAAHGRRSRSRSPLQSLLTRPTHRREPVPRVRVRVACPPKRQAAATHEIGHVLGLSHPDNVADSLCTHSAACSATPGSNSFHEYLSTGSRWNADQPPPSPPPPLAPPGATIPPYAPSVLGANRSDSCMTPWAGVRDGVPADCPPCRECLDCANCCDDDGVRPSIMKAFTQHNPRVCLSADDLEALNVLYPDCSHAITTPVCYKFEHNIGYVRPPRHPTLATPCHNSHKPLSPVDWEPSPPLSSQVRLGVWVLFPTLLAMLAMLLISGYLSHKQQQSLDTARALRKVRSAELVQEQKAHRRLSVQHQQVQQELADREQTEAGRVEQRARRLSVQYINNHLAANPHLASEVPAPSSSADLEAVPPLPPCAAKSRGGWGGLTEMMSQVMSSAIPRGESRRRSSVGARVTDPSVRFEAAVTAESSTPLEEDDAEDDLGAVMAAVEEAIMSPPTGTGTGDHAEEEGHEAGAPGASRVSLGGAGCSGAAAKLGRLVKQMSRPSSVVKVESTPILDHAASAAPEDELEATLPGHGIELRISEEAHRPASPG